MLNRVGVHGVVHLDGLGLPQAPGAPAGLLDQVDRVLRLVEKEGVEGDQVSVTWNTIMMYRILHIHLLLVSHQYRHLKYSLVFCT